MNDCDLSDAKVMRQLTVVLHERLGPAICAQIARMEREGVHTTAYEVAGFVPPASLPPLIIIHHAARRPSMRAIRIAYADLVLRFTAPEGTA